MSAIRLTFAKVRTLIPTEARLGTARLVVLCLVCIAPQAPILPAQEPNAPPSEIYGSPRYAHFKLPDGAVRFVDSDTGVSFILPVRWGFGNEGLRFMDRGWKGNGEGDFATTVFLHHRQTGTGIWLYYCIFRHANPMTPQQTDKWLLAEVDDKISQRRTYEKLKNYHVRPSGYQPEEIGGRRALALVADFTEGKANMVEYLVWVRSDRSLAEFSTRCPETELDAVRKDVEPVIQSLEIQ